MSSVSYSIETEQEEDGRWIADIITLPGVMAYGDSRDEAIANAEAIALRVIADQIQESGQGIKRHSRTYCNQGPPMRLETAEDMFGPPSGSSLGCSSVETMSDAEIQSRKYPARRTPSRFTGNKA
jgi:predicted RNase H-like HicB family nuclease